MTRLFRIVRAIRRDRRGSVLMIFGFAVIPLVFAVGMGIDYARAMKAQTKLNAVADAAALVAVSKTVMSVDDTSAASFATQMFLVQAQSVLANAQVTLTGLTTAAPTDKNGRRTATVTYTGQSTNAFARILGLSSLDDPRHVGHDQCHGTRYRFLHVGSMYRAQWRCRRHRRA